VFINETARRAIGQGGGGQCLRHSILAGEGPNRSKPALMKPAGSGGSAEKIALSGKEPNIAGAGKLRTESVPCSTRHHIGDRILHDFKLQAG